MARTSRQANASKNDKLKLKRFDKGLPLKNVTTDTLQQSLKDLATQLVAFDQDHVDLSSIGPVKPHLVDRKLLLHKDKGVKAYLCVCLAEILRLYAPEAPYTQDELADIFQFFFRQLSNITSQAAYYDQYYHLLESLSDIKSVVLVCDLERWDEVVIDVFKDCFNIVKKSDSFFGGTGLPRKVELFISDILGALLEECPTIPDKVLDLLLAPFSEPFPGEATEARGKLRDTTKAATKDPSAGPGPQLRVASGALNTTKDKLQRNVGIYFTDIIVKTSTGIQLASDPDSDSDSEGERDSGGLTPKQVREIEAAHLLIRNLHLHCPGVLISVIPQLEEELRAEDLDIRGIATTTLGKMYTTMPLRGAELVKSHPSTWAQWMTRRNDKSSYIRTIWAGFIKGLLLIPGSDVRAVVQKAVSSKMHDPDEKMRVAVIQNFENLDYETALRHIDQTILIDLAGRGLDRKHSVRYAALTALGRLWDLAYPEIASNDPQARHHFGWIPAELLAKMYTSSIEVRPMIEEIAHTYIFPLPAVQDKGKGNERDMNQPTDESLHTDRILNTLKLIAISPSAEAAGLHEIPKLIDRIMGLAALRVARPTLHQHYLGEITSSMLDTNADKKSEEKSARLGRWIQQLAINLSGGVAATRSKIADDLHTFASLGDQKLVSLAKKACDVEVDMKSLAKMTNDFQKRLHAANPLLLSTMNTFLRKGTLRIINESSIPSLLEKLRVGPITMTESQSQMTTVRRDTISSQQLSVEHVQAILIYVAKWRPELYKHHLDGLLEILGDDMCSEEIKEVALTALSSVAKIAPDLVRKGVPDTTHDSIRTLVLHTTNWRLAKFGARYLAFAGHVREDDGEIVNEDTLGVAEAIAAIFSSALEKPILDGGEDIITDDYVLSHVTVLVQFARFSKEAFEARSEVFVKYFTQRILMLTADEADRELLTDTEEWITDSDMTPFLRAKIQSIKALRHRCLSFATDERAAHISKPILTMLLNIITQGGSIIEAEEDPRVLARMRLQAAVSLLHVCTVKVYVDSLGAYLAKVAFMVQDQCFEVRYTFMQKLVPLLFARKVDSKFNILPFLSAPDPENDSKAMATTYVISAQVRMPEPLRLQWFELILPRMLELLAQHPMFSTDSVEDFETISKELQMYIDLVVTQDNLSLLYHLANKCKTIKTKDAEICENFWILSEVTQELMKIRAHRKGWNINNFPGHVKLPSDIFVAFPDNESTNNNLKKSYTPNHLLNWLQDEIVKPVGKAGTKRKAGGQPVKKKSKRRKSGGSDDDDESVAGDPSSDLPMDDIDEKAPSKKKRASATTAKSRTKANKKEEEEEDMDDSEVDFKPPKPSGRTAPKPKPRPRRKKVEEKDKDTDVEMEDSSPKRPKPRSTRKKAEKNVEMQDADSELEEDIAPPRPKPRSSRKKVDYRETDGEVDGEDATLPPKGKERKKEEKIDENGDISAVDENIKRPKRAPQPAKPSPRKTRPRSRNRPINKRDSSVEA